MATAAPATETRSSASKRIRKIFGNIHEVCEMPNLIEVQRESYEQFLRSRPGRIGYVSGLEKTLRSVFPIRDFAGTAELDFVHYELEDPKYDTDECRQRGMTYAAPMRVTLRLIVFEVDPDTETRSVLDIKEQDVYMGDMPLMTKNGTFIVNGTERVIVSQMHRSPGVLFDHDRGKTHASGKYLFAARVIPYRGSWLDFEFDAKDIVNVRIDRKRKLPVTALLHALGLTSEEILNTFYNRVTYRPRPERLADPVRQPSNWRGQKPTFDVVNAETGEVVFPAGQKITPARRQQGGQGRPREAADPDRGDFRPLFSAYDLVNDSTGEIYIEAGDEVSPENLEKLDKAGDRPDRAARHRSRQHRRLDAQHAEGRQGRGSRPGAGRHLPRHAPRRAADAGDRRGAVRRPVLRSRALRPVGRRPRQAQHAPRPRRRGHRHDAAHARTSSRSSRSWSNLKDGKGEIDDIDNLGNRRVRSVGELLENQYRVGLLRMERAVKERMSSVDVSTVMPNDLINAKPAVAAVREFFGSSQLSQFMDQTNPLSEVTHKRRVSALGPGGLTRERAGFEVRDVHPTHYGRICPIETPEGPNIGLINSLATLQPGQQIRLHRDAVPQGHRPQGDQRRRLSVGDGGGRSTRSRRPMPSSTRTAASSRRSSRRRRPATS